MKINVSNFKCQNGISFPAVYKIEVHFTADGTLDLIKYVIYMELAPCQCCHSWSGAYHLLLIVTVIVLLGHLGQERV